MELRGFYATQRGTEFLQRTENGKFAFTWVAEYVDGKVVLQLQQDLFDRAVKDTQFVIETANVLSVSKLDVRQVKRFHLIPTAMALQYVPLRHMQVIVRLDEGEKLVTYWLTDKDPYSEKTLTRTVIGISKLVNGLQSKSLVVVSPSGNVTVATTDDNSYEGE